MKNKEIEDCEFSLISSLKFMKEVYEIIKKIPKGKVTTYSEIAKVMGIHPRKVAKILSKNKNPKIPCYRVVYSNGRVGGYKFGGKKEKIRKLRKENIKIRGDKIVNFSEKLFRFNTNQY